MSWTQRMPSSVVVRVAASRCCRRVPDRDASVDFVDDRPAAVGGGPGRDKAAAGVPVKGQGGRAQGRRRVRPVPHRRAAISGRRQGHGSTLLVQPRGRAFHPGDRAHLGHRDPLALAFCGRAKPIL